MKRKTVRRKGGKRTKEKCEERRGWRDRVSERVAAGETRAFCPSLDGMGWMKLVKMEVEEGVGRSNERKKFPLKKNILLFHLFI